MVTLAHSDKEFVKIVKEAGDVPLVVDFYATWCKPCTLMAPVFVNFAQTVGDKAIFVKVNVDECEDTADLYKVSSMPTFAIIKNGEFVKRVTGANPAKLAQMLKDL